MAVLHDLPLPVSPLQLHPQPLHLLLQPQELVALTPLALLVLLQLLLQLLHLGGVGWCQHRQLLIQKLVLLVLQSTYQKQEKKSTSDISACSDALQKQPLKSSSMVGDRPTITNVSMHMLMKFIKLKAISKLWQKLHNILAMITEAFIKLVSCWYHSEQRQTTLGSTGNQTKIRHFYHSFQMLLLNEIGLQFWAGLYYSFCTLPFYSWIPYLQKPGVTMQNCSLKQRSSQNPNFKSCASSVILSFAQIFTFKALSNDLLPRELNWKFSRLSWFLGFKSKPMGTTLWLMKHHHY